MLGGPFAPEVINMREHRAIELFEFFCREHDDLAAAGDDDHLFTRANAKCTTDGEWDDDLSACAHCGSAVEEILRMLHEKYVKSYQSYSKRKCDAKIFQEFLRERNPSAMLGT